MDRKSLADLRAVAEYAQQLETKELAIAEFYEKRYRNAQDREQGKTQYLKDCERDAEVSQAEYEAAHFLCILIDKELSRTIEILQANKGDEE